MAFHERYIHTLSTHITHTNPAVDEQKQSAAGFLVPHRAAEASSGMVCARKYVVQHRTAICYLRMHFCAVMWR